MRIRGHSVGAAIHVAEELRNQVARYLRRLPRMRQLAAASEERTPRRRVSYLGNALEPVSMQEEEWLRSYARGRSLAELGDGSRFVEGEVVRTVRRAVVAMILSDRTRHPPNVVPDDVPATPPPPVLG